jgi:hypothetical protein
MWPSHNQGAYASGTYNQAFLIIITITMTLPIATTGNRGSKGSKKTKITKQQGRSQADPGGARRSQERGKQMNKISTLK